MSGLGRMHLTQYPLRYYAKLNMAGPKVSFNLSHVCLLYLRGRRGVASVPRSSDSKQTCMFLTVFSVHDGRGKNPSAFEITTFNGIKRTHFYPTQGPRRDLARTLERGWGRTVVPSS